MNWQRVVVGRAYKDKYSDHETIDPTLWSMSASKDAVQQQLAASLPDAEGPLQRARALLDDFVGKMDSPGATLHVRVEEATNDPRASRLREIHITIRVLPGS